MASNSFGSPKPQFFKKSVFENASDKIFSSKSKKPQFKNTSDEIFASKVNQSQGFGSSQMNQGGDYERS